LADSELISLRIDGDWGDLRITVYFGFGLFKANFSLDFLAVSTLLS
jgi:hypothetical protein